MPSHGSRPTTGFIRVQNTTEATATEVTTVEEKIVRNTAIPFSLRWAATARARPTERAERHDQHHEEDRRHQALQEAAEDVST